MRLAALAARARRLSAAEWRVLGESAALAVIIEVALRLVPLARILQSIEGRALQHASPLDRAAQDRVARLARWPSRVLPLPSTCLRVALVQVAVLRRRQVPATVRFGVRRPVGGELEFHAWAESDGPFDEPAGVDGYRAFEPVAAGAISRSARWSPPAAPPGVAV
jgi:transglutaminase superfamily protein